MKRIILALLALCFTQSAFAQSFPKPPDVPAYDASNPPVYRTTSGLNRPIDPTVTPPTQTGLTNIPIPSQTGRVDTTATQDETSASAFCKTIYYGGTNPSCTENKFRTIVDFSHMLPDDPIRNYGQPGTSHLHCFFGSGSTNAYSTYKTLRQHAIDSTSAGTDANATGYWFPCLSVINPYSNGKNYAIKLDEAVVYYTNGDTIPKADLPVGIRYVFGFDMDSTSPSTQYAWLQTILDATNATIGHTRYQLSPGGHMLTQAVYSCTGATPVTVYSIVNADGTDPYGGTCASNAEFYAEIVGPDCWDGKNLWSPGGYKHLIPRVWDQDNSEWVCPTNYYLMPTLVIQFRFTQHGWADRQRWVLSSDLSYRTARGLNATQVPAGSTFHTDWMFGWDNLVMQQWEHNCVGTLGNVGHQCNSSFIAINKQLTGAGGGLGVGGRNPQVDPSPQAHVNENDPGWMRIPNSWTAALLGLHIHH